MNKRFFMNKQFSMNERLSPAGAVLCVWTACLVLSAAADPIIQFRPGQPIQCNEAPLGAATTYAIPCVVDWNRDGRKDLLVGYQSEGKIALYLNVGTDAQPLFTNSTIINLKTSGGGDIKYPAGGCGAPAPWVCDFDGDGKQDLLVGDGDKGKVYFHRNLNADPNATPILAAGVPLMVGTNILTVDSRGRATPLVCDWNGDGLNDLLCGDYDGYVWFFRNTNTAQAPIFDSGVKIQAGATNLRLGGSLGGVGRSFVRLFDFDGDGLRDLVCSSDGGVYWCRNTNSDLNPILQPPVPIYVPVTNHLVPVITGSIPGSRMRSDVADWNNDGVMDLILGDYSGKVYFFEGYRFALTRVTSQPGGQTVLQWNSSSNLNYNILAGSSPGDLLIKVANNLPSGGNTTLWTNTAAGNQQFYRVQTAP